MKDLILVSMVEPVDVGSRFTTWPLHMTLFSWFTAPSLQDVTSQLRESLSNQEPFLAQMAGRAYFGQQKLAVKRVELTPVLKELHDSLLEIASNSNWPVKGRYVGDQFSPHVTQQNGRDASGAFMVDAVYVVESQPQGYRQVLDRIVLS